MQNECLVDRKAVSPKADPKVSLTKDDAWEGKYKDAKPKKKHYSHNVLLRH